MQTLFSTSQHLLQLLIKNVSETKLLFRLSRSNEKTVIRSENIDNSRNTRPCKVGKYYLLNNNTAALI